VVSSFTTATMMLSVAVVNGDNFVFLPKVDKNFPKKFF